MDTRDPTNTPFKRNSTRSDRVLAQAALLRMNMITYSWFNNVMDAAAVNTRVCPVVARVVSTHLVPVLGLFVLFTLTVAPPTAAHSVGVPAFSRYTSVLDTPVGVVARAATSANESSNCVCGSTSGFNGSAAAVPGALDAAAAG